LGFVGLNRTGFFFASSQGLVFEEIAGTLHVREGFFLETKLERDALSLSTIFSESSTSSSLIAIGSLLKNEICLSENLKIIFLGG
jgi:hypothetical protein